MQLQPPFILSLLVKDQEGSWLPRGSPLCHRPSWRPLIGQVMYGYFYDPQAYKAINKSPSFTSMEKRCRIQQWLSLLYSFSHSSYCICSVANPFFLLPKKKKAFVLYHFIIFLGEGGIQHFSWNHIAKENQNPTYRKQDKHLSSQPYHTHGTHDVTPTTLHHKD